MMMKRPAKIVIWSACLILLFLLGGCGDDDDDNGGGDVGMTVTGVATKGPMLNCTIQVFILMSDGSRGDQVAGAPVTGPVITQAPDGSWTANIPGDQPGPFTVEAGGPDCVYFDEATGTERSTGGTPILGLLPVGATSVAITPLTHALVLAVQDTLARAAAAGQTANPATTLDTVIANASAIFGFDPVRTLPPDPRQLPAASDNTIDQLEYATILGALSQVLNAADDIADFATEFTTLAQDLTDGELNGVTALQDPTTDVNLLADAQGNGLTGNNLQEVSNNFATNPPNVAELDREGFQAAATSAPVSITRIEASCEALAVEVIEGEQTTLTVTAIAPNNAPLTFAWSQVIPTAPRGSFTSPNAAESGFIAPEVDVDTLFTLQVTVSNNQGLSTPCPVEVTVLSVPPLVVTVVGNGRLLDPWPNIRVLRHDPTTGAFIDERTTDASGIADFGDIGTTRTTITIVLEDRDEDTLELVERVLETYLDIPTGQHVVSLGRIEDEAAFAVDLTEVPAGSSAGVVTPGSYDSPCGSEPTLGFDPAGGMVSIGELVSVDNFDTNGLFGLLGYALDDDGDTVSAWGFLSDLDPDSFPEDLADESLVTIPLTGSATTVPYTLNEPVETASSCFRINGLIYGIVDVIFAPEVPEASATGVVDALDVPGADGFAFSFVDIQGQSVDVSPPGTPPDEIRVTVSLQGRELFRSFSSIPTNITGTMPDLAFAGSAWDGNTKTLSWTLSGADVSQLAVVSTEIEFSVAETEFSWTLLGKPTLTSITLPGLPDNLADSVPDASVVVDYSIDAVGVDNLANFDDFITSFSSVSGDVGALVYSGNRLIRASDLNFNETIQLSGSNCGGIDDIVSCVLITNIAPSNAAVDIADCNADGVPDPPALDATVAFTFRNDASPSSIDAAGAQDLSVTIQNVSVFYTPQCTAGQICPFLSSHSEPLVIFLDDNGGAATEDITLVSAFTQSEYADAIPDPDNPATYIANYRFTVRTNLSDDAFDIEAAVPFSIGNLSCP